MLLLILTGCGSGGGSGDGNGPGSSSAVYGDGNGSTYLSWIAPTTNTDGSQLTDLAGFRVYYGTSSESYSNSVDVGNVASCYVTGLGTGDTYYFAITAYDLIGNESGYSNELIRTAKLAEP